MSLPTIMTLTVENEKPPPGRGARLSPNRPLPGKPSDFGFHFGCVLVGQGAGLTLHGTDQTWKLSLSSKQWMEFECHMSRLVRAWGIGAIVAKLLQTKPKGNACRGWGCLV